MSEPRPLFLTRVVVALAVLTLAVIPVVAQLDDCFSGCHTLAMSVYNGPEDLGFASWIFESCMYFECGVVM